MKTYLTIFLIAASSLIYSQISTTRVNDLKIGMKLSEVEKITNQKLELTKDENDWLYMQDVDYKGLKLNLGFMEMIDENEQSTFQLYEISTTSTQVKTLSKLGVGNSLEDLWKAYKNYNISVWNQWDEKIEKYSTNERVFQIDDFDTSTALYFYLKEGKVYKISVSFNEGG